MCAVSDSGYIWVVMHHGRRVKGLPKYDSYEEAEKALIAYDMKNAGIYHIYREWIR